jgi:sortase A
MMKFSGNEFERGVRHPALRWTSRAFFLAGLSCLAWSTYVIVDAREFQNKQNELLNEQQHQISLVKTPPESSAETTPEILLPAPGLLGRLEIPRLALSAIVMEGSDAKTLRRAAGHVSGTALPGQEGNAVITGHRDTFFRPLRNIRPGDQIRFTSSQATYLYRVESIGVLRPGDVELLHSSRGRVLTLVTCYPFYFVGPAPERFIVRAEWVSGQN